MYIIFISAHTTIVEVKRSTLFNNCRISKFNRKRPIPIWPFFITKSSNIIFIKIL